MVVYTYLDAADNSDDLSMNAAMMFMMANMDMGGLFPGATEATGRPPRGIVKLPTYTRMFVTEYTQILVDDHSKKAARSMAQKNNFLCSHLIFEIFNPIKFYCCLEPNVV